MKGPQNNWLFTQYIDASKPADDSDVTIYVNITYRIKRCITRGLFRCRKGFEIRHYIPIDLLDSPRNMNSYVSLANLSIDDSQKVEQFTLSRNQYGFYLALIDEGACVTVNRLIVYHLSCPQQQHGLVLYPRTPAPVRGQNPVNVSCVENADVSNNSLSCDSEGNWQGSPECICNPGYVDDHDSCKPDTVTGTCTYV